MLSKSDGPGKLIMLQWKIARPRRFKQLKLVLEDLLKRTQIWLDREGGGSGKSSEVSMIKTHCMKLSKTDCV